ncbi:MAG TPA: M48 family metallopeptidase [Candidatus Hydrogenedens sp.]|nr:M48 family metallopeptidase [Candidatus Hydrogenedens sp.]
MFELVRKNKHRSVIFACIMLFFMLALGYSIGAFISYCCYYGELSQPDRQHRTVQRTPYDYPQSYSQDYQEPVYRGKNISYLSPQQIYYFIWFYWGPLGALVTFFIWFVQMIYAYYSGGNMLLSISNAVPIEKQDCPQLYNIVEEISIASRLPKIPEIYIVDSPEMNAFATGRSPEHSAIAVTRGLINNMNRDQIQSVIAHEISHIVHRDTLYMTILAVSVGTIILIVVGLREVVGAGIRGSTRYSRRRDREGSGLILLFLIVIYIFALILSVIAPLLAQIIYFASSRQREYLADAGAVVFTRNPEGLASALETIANGYAHTSNEDVNKVVAPLYIVNPLEAHNLNASSIFSTHPPLQKRIQILRNIAKTPSLTSYEQAWQQVVGKKWKQPLLSETPQPAPVSSTSSQPQPAAQQSLAQASIAPTQSSATPPSTPQQKARITGDAIMKAKKFTFLNCQCGVILKMPPNYKGKVKCPRCQTIHNITK